MTAVRIILGILLVVGAIWLMAANPGNIFLWIIGGALAAGGVVLVFSAFRKKPQPYGSLLVTSMSW